MAGNGVVAHKCFFNKIISSYKFEVIKELGKVVVVYMIQE